ncbi:class I adenylate-forming enzyme family protein [Kribbia dieselivorans]|uniref:class I adenylate-forming enzyme family protein n=1 Tax=Kribbia dieselivorans TaxID=331526 RepID=UPI000837AC5F|nr:AMP-binding protein [Kribbia dieselivorans]
MIINDLVRYWGRTRPEHEAIVFEDTVQTWQELDAVSDSLARGLAANGIVKGDRVGILMRNRLETAALMLAALKAGAICAPLNFRLAPPELAGMIADCTPKIIVAEGDFAALLSQAREQSEFEVFTTEPTDHRPYADLLVEAGDAPHIDVVEDDVAFICYTSGTTGVQKGAMLTHKNILSVAQSAVLATGLTGRDRVLAAAPLVYTGSGISVFMQFVVYPGATMILCDFNPDSGLQAMEKHKVTATTLVPVIYERMAMMPDFATRDVAQFNFAGAGGAPVRPDLLETYRNRGLVLTQVYGLTEVAGLATMMRYEDAVSRPGFAGLPLLGTELRIGEPGNWAAPGEVGEILVRGPHVMKGYWNRPEATAEVMVDGWLRTGDLGLQDEQGFLKLVDRSKDMLISGGLNVYPAEIERVLAGVEGVQELAVIGVPDETWGEVPMVVFNTQGDASEVAARLHEAAAANLAKFKQPKSAVAVDGPLPRTFSGKLAKPLLRQQFPARPDSAISLTH